MSDADSAFAPPDAPSSARSSAGGNSGMETAAAIGFIFSGTLLVLWGLWSVIGTFTGVMISALGIATGEEEMLMGIGIGIIYGLWMVISFTVGGLQLFTGIRMVLGKHVDKLLWAATLSSLAAVLTFYCAMPAMVAFALGLAAALTRMQDTDT